MNRFFEKKSVVIALLLMLVGVARVAFFSAAFPFFNNVDEHAHVDLVVKYSHGWLPRLDNIDMDKESARLFVLYGSPEYFHKINETVEPIWKQLADDQALKPTVERRISRYKQADNHEQFSPPLYYCIWGQWYALGKYLGVSEKYILYWLKLPNLLIYLLLMLVAYHISKLLLPDDVCFRLSVLALLAVFPQDVFYSVNNDVLSSLLVPGSWLLMLLAREGGVTRKLLFAAGVVASLSVLTKLTNLPVLVFALLFTLWMSTTAGGGRMTRGTFISFALALVLPLSCWLAYNYYCFGTFLATDGKIEYLGWENKDVRQWWDHPVFTLPGMKGYLLALCASFWRGEFVWHAKTLHTHRFDLLYCYTSMIFLASGIVAGLVNWKQSREFGIALFSGILIAGYVGFLILLSIKYDFGKGFYPSSGYPFISSGRLAAGALVPFAVLYVYGARALLRMVRLEKTLLPVTAVYAAVILAHEITLSLPAIASTFNFFHI